MQKHQLAYDKIIEMKQTPNPLNINQVSQIILIMLVLQT